jgi:ketosteroid isomerase-like protein
MPSAEDEIRRLDDEARDAVLRGDAAALETLLAEDYLVTNPYGQVLGKRQLLEALRLGRIRHASYERQIEQLRVHGNTAIAMGHETVVDAGPVIRRRYTEVWLRAGERWQAVARHANEIGKV